MRAIAVDWSGAKTGAEKTIWLGEAVGGELVRLENGRNREAIAAYLTAEAERDPALVVGIDFAFSLPAWFLDERGLSDAPALWVLAEKEAEGWLSACEPPFWGRSPTPRPPEATPERRFRWTERQVREATGSQPKSVFQLNYRGAVGVGSLRGMPILRRLRQAGFRVWPFDAVATDRPTVVEIYPRLLVESVRRRGSERNAAEQRGWMDANYPGLPAAMRQRAADDEHAFDAAVSALVMADNLTDLTRLPPRDDPRMTREGIIWWPDWQAWH